jgi:hypothetical protein
MKVGRIVQLSDKPVQYRKIGEQMGLSGNLIVVPKPEPIIIPMATLRAQLAARLTPEKLLEAVHVFNLASENTPKAVDAMRQSLLDTLTGEGEG